MPKIISPISIDLGANNTGVYFAHYPAGGSLEEIKKEGKVYQLEKDKYTLLMAKRTAARHQRRGYDRKQMVKRLVEPIFLLNQDSPIALVTLELLKTWIFSYLLVPYNILNVIGRPLHKVISLMAQLIS